MSGEIVVYWANNFFNYEAIEPDYAIKDLYERVEKIEAEDLYGTKDVIKCPVTSLYLRNTFRVKSPIDYSIFWDKVSGTLTSKHFDQDFFDKFIHARSPKSGVLSMFFGSTAFFTEEDNLTMELKAANYADNELVNNISYIPGEIDVGRYFRFVDFCYFINSPNKLLRIKRGDSLYYVRFFTDKKVVLKKFNVTPKIRELVEPVARSNKIIRESLKNVSVWNKLESYYDVFKTSKIKNAVVREIKNNILD